MFDCRRCRFQIADPLRRARRFHTCTIGDHLGRKCGSIRCQIAFGQGIDQAERQGLCCRNLAPGEHQLQRGFSTDQARQALRTTRAGQETEQDFGQAELGRRHGDAVMRSQSHFKATAQGHAGNRRQHRFAASFDAVAYIGQGRRLRRLAEFAHISPGTERLSFANENNDLHRRIGLGCRNGIVKVLAQGLAQRVDWWIT